MKLNDLVTWAGSNGETRHGKITSLHGIYARVERWQAYAKKPRRILTRQDRLIAK